MPAPGETATVADTVATTGTTGRPVHMEAKICYSECNYAANR